MTPAEVNAEIARMRGWEGVGGCWRPVDCGEVETMWAEDQAAIRAAGLNYWDDETPPIYCSEWALAGPLLEEMPMPSLFLVRAGAVAWASAAAWGEPRSILGDGWSPTEAIARAWLAWRKAGG